MLTVINELDVRERDQVGGGQPQPGTTGSIGFPGGPGIPFVINEQGQTVVFNPNTGASHLIPKAK